MSAGPKTARKHPRAIQHHRSLMVLHDARLEGYLSPIHGYSLQTDKHSSVPGSIHRLASWAKLGQGVIHPNHNKKTSLIIVAHGYESHSKDNKMSVEEGTCGFGLQIGSSGLTLANLHLMKELFGLVDWIVLYACGPANTASGNAGTLGDGNRFCTEMACNTGANVIASSSVQYYQTNGPIHFTHWRPPLFQFHPDGTRTGL